MSCVSENLSKKTIVVSYISSSSEDLGKDHSSQSISAIVQCGYNKFKHSILVFQRAQIQQAIERKRAVKQKLINHFFSILGVFCAPLKQTTFLQHFDSLWVCRQCPQEEEVVLAECGQQAIALKTPFGFQSRRQGQP